MIAIRRFDGGATRDDEGEKNDYEGFFSPLVLEAFGDYMSRHRKTAEGVRDSDNWQKGFGSHHKDVCMKSGWRHFLDWWKEHRGIPSRDGIEAAICGLLFNLMAYYHELLKSRLDEAEKGIE